MDDTQKAILDNLKLSGDSVGNVIPSEMQEDSLNIETVKPEVR